MGYSLSFDASVKIKMADVKGLLNHVARDVDLQNGMEVRHSNPNIDSSRTARNETLYYDQDEGAFKECTDSGQIERSLKKRLSCVKKPLRKDAVVLRPLILQLDPEWYEDYEDVGRGESEGTSIDCMLEWAISKFGEENIVCASVHHDEFNPHLHVLFAPVTKDGRLSQKDWFKDPSSLRELHKDFRNHMAENGYEVDSENRKPGKYAKRMGEAEYRDYAKLRQKNAELDSRMKRVREREADLKARESDLKAREGDFEAKMDKTLLELEKALKTALSVSEAYHEAYERLPSGAKVSSKPAELDRESYSKLSSTVKVLASNSREISGLPDWYEDFGKEISLSQELQV